MPLSSRVENGRDRSNGKEELYGDDCDQRYFLSHLAEAAENHTPSGTVLSNSAENTPNCTSSADNRCVPNVEARNAKYPYLLFRGLTLRARSRN